MNSPRFDRFSQPHYLQRIGRERVTQILLPLATELLPHGIALPATALPDDLFFQVLATLPRRAAECSQRLLEAMTAIEVINEVFPDERTPLVFSELRLRVRVKSRPVLLSPDRHQGVLDVEVCGGLEGGLGVRAEDGGSRMEDGEDHGAQRTASPTICEDVARSAFALLQKLELDAPLKSPSVLTVFRLYCVDGFSADRVARKCRCAKGTVMSRLRFIEERTGVKPQQFRAMSGHLQQVDDDLNASGAREIYRSGLANEGEE